MYEIQTEIFVTMVDLMKMKIQYSNKTAHYQEKIQNGFLLALKANINFYQDVTSFPFQTSIPFQRYLNILSIEYYMIILNCFNVTV